MSAILDKTLTDDLGNTCRVSVHSIGGGHVSAYFVDFNGSVPRRYDGEPGVIQSLVDIWLSHRAEKGWKAKP